MSEGFLKIKIVKLKSFLLFLLLLFIIITGNVKTLTDESQSIVITMKQVIQTIAREKAHLPKGFGSPQDLVEALAENPGICQKVARAIKVKIPGGESDESKMTAPFIPSGKALLSIFRMMSDYRMLDYPEEKEVWDTMQSTPQDKWEISQLPERVRSKIFVIYQIARSSDPHRLASALVMNSHFSFDFDGYSRFDIQDSGNPAELRDEIQKKRKKESGSIGHLESRQESTRQTWARVYGGTAHEYGTHFCQTSDGGYILAGSHSPQLPGNYDCWIVKASSSGRIEWQRAYGGVDSDSANSVYQTSDGGYIIGGSTSSLGAGERDFLLLKLSSNGDIEWQRIYGGSSDELLYDFQLTGDGGYIATGRSAASGSEDIWIMKLTAGGDITWQRSYGGIYDDSAHSIQQTSDGGYVVHGYTGSLDSIYRADIWTLKLSSAGDIEWQWAYGDDQGYWGSSIQQTSDGGYILACSTGPAIIGGADGLVIKLSSGGDIEWQRVYSGRYDDFIDAVQQTMDGGFVVLGTTYSFGAGSGDFLLFKLSSTGEIEWQRTYGGIDPDTAVSVQQSPDGGYIVAGYTYSYGAGGSDFLVLKISSDGNMDRLPELVGSANLSFSAASAVPYVTNIIPQETDVTPQDAVLIPYDTQLLGTMLFSPPINITYQTAMNRSLSQAEYTNILRWEPNPNNNDIAIVKYKIYLNHHAMSLLGEVDASTLEFWHPKAWRDQEFHYAIVGVNDEGGKGIPAFFIAQSEEGKHQ